MQTWHRFAGFWTPGSQVWLPMVQPVTQAPVASQTLPVPQTLPVDRDGWVQLPLAQTSAVQGSESEAHAAPSVVRVQLWLWVRLWSAQVPDWQVGWVQVRLSVPVVSQGPAPAAGPQVLHCPHPGTAPQAVPLATGVKALVEVEGAQASQPFAGLGSFSASRLPPTQQPVWQAPVASQTCPVPQVVPADAWVQAVPEVVGSQTWQGSPGFTAPAA